VPQLAELGLWEGGGMTTSEARNAQLQEDAEFLAAVDKSVSSIYYEKATHINRFGGDVSAGKALLGVCILQAARIIAAAIREAK
jgi:hypothetical protein